MSLSGQDRDMLISNKLPIQEFDAGIRSEVPLGIHF
jgi:hypothetical protein